MDTAGLTAGPAGPVDWSRLETLVESREHAAHWQLSARFLSILSQAWPQLLAEEGRSDPAVAASRAIHGLAARWRASPPHSPVVVAGSTGAIPAVRELMTVVRTLPRGLVVLPGLDAAMPDSDWQQAERDPQHPQASLAATLAHLGLARSDVAPWPLADDTLAPGPEAALRQRVLNEALSPKDATADWLARVGALQTSSGADAVGRALTGLRLLQAEQEDEEASAIAVHLRGVLEHPGRTAALVTPDRTIARRVAAKLRRWDIEVDVSAGTPLGQTPVGSFLRLAATWALDTGDPLALVALLAHPLCRVGLPLETVAAGRDGLERALLHQARKDADSLALARRAAAMDAGAFAHRRADQQSAVRLARQLEGLVLPGLADQTLGELAGGWVRLAEALAATPDQDGATVLWQGAAGETAAALLAGLVDQGGRLEPMAPRDGVRCLDRLMQEVAVRPAGAHPRLSILGPLEARLLSFDEVVLAGMDEGIWPAPPQPDPFLSPVMRAGLGLPPVEEAVGLSAHDFAQLACAPAVTLTRSARRGDAPAVPSRWLWRLRTLVRATGDAALVQALDSMHPALVLARAMVPQRLADPAAAKPAPRPPLEARPTEFSATQIETWIRDPYTLYVKKVLGLDPLDPIGGDPGAAERGTAVHAALEIVGAWYPQVPDDADMQLRARLKLELAAAGFAGQALASELVRMEPTIAFVVRMERQRRRDGWCPLVERWVRATLDTPAGPVRLKAKADRIDVNPDGRLEVLDFKTGTPKTPRQIETMMAPQLPVTAMIIAEAPQEPPIPQQAATDFAYLHTGGRTPLRKPGIDGKSPSPDELIATARMTVARLAVRYGDPAMPYQSKPRVQFAVKVTYDEPVDRLARRGEWADVAGDSGGEG
jgi:ATP-dependent helicase/nuclease subunit B